MVKDPKDITTNWKLDGGWKNHSDGPHCNLGNSARTLAKGEKI